MDDTVNGDDLCEKAVTRQEQADRLPFFLRAWWLRDFLETEDYCGLKTPVSLRHFGRCTQILYAMSVL